jgi:hypothetical protein
MTDADNNYPRSRIYLNGILSGIVEPFQEAPVIASSSSVALHDSPSRHRHPHHLTRTSAVGCIPADMEKVMQYEILQPDSKRPFRLVGA